jgi:hypothetical protein
MLRTGGNANVSDEQKAAAEKALKEALKTTGVSDPRDAQRQNLRALRQVNPGGYDEAVAYYQDTLVPAIASGRADPLRAWRDYGRKLAELTVEGRTVEIDGTGRAKPCSADPPLESLILHVPEGKKGTRALLVSRPIHPTPAQEATYHLLVLGKQRLPG